MTATTARKLLKNFLDERGIPYRDLKAKTVSFQDLARGEAIFVRIFGFMPSEENYNAVRAFGKDHGFIVQL